MVLCIPEGSSDDGARLPEFCNETYEYLKQMVFRRSDFVNKIRVKLGGFVIFVENMSKMICFYRDLLRLETKEEKIYKII